VDVFPCPLIGLVPIKRAIVVLHSSITQPLTLGLVLQHQHVMPISVFLTKKVK